MQDKDIDHLVASMAAVVHDRPVRRAIQERGLNVVPSNFYSTIPSYAEVDNSFEYREGEPPYMATGIFDQASLQADLESLVDFAAEFDPPQEGSDTGEQYFWQNGQFSYSDAMSNYALLRRNKPRSVVEIGCGFSSLCTLEALARNGAGRLTCFEPYPRPFITALDERGVLDLHRVFAQDVTPGQLGDLLQDGDVLFIDSTHTVKAGSDCLHIYLRLLPKIERRILVHVHDVFLPFGMPKHWLVEKDLYWTEQYLLLAFLLDNPRVRVVFGSNYHQHFNLELLKKFMHGRALPGGSSIWFEYDGRR